MISISFAISRPGAARIKHRNVNVLLVTSFCFIWLFFRSVYNRERNILALNAIISLQLQKWNYIDGFVSCLCSMFGNCVGLFSRVGSLQIMLVLLLFRWQSSFDTHISIFKVPFLFYLPICYCRFPNKRSRSWKGNSRLDVLLDLIY